MDEVGLVQQGPDVQILAPAEIGLDICAYLQYADDVVDAALVHGQAAVPLLLYEGQDIGVAHVRRVGGACGHGRQGIRT